jgi:hypothetical protein
MRRPDFAEIITRQLAEECTVLQRASYERLWLEINRDSIELLRQRVAGQSRQALGLLDYAGLQRP